MLTLIEQSLTDYAKQLREFRLEQNRNDSRGLVSFVFNIAENLWMWPALGKLASFTADALRHSCSGPEFAAIDTLDNGRQYKDLQLLKILGDPNLPTLSNLAVHELIRGLPAASFITRITKNHQSEG
jgi:hypothetical protein